MNHIPANIDAPIYPLVEVERVLGMRPGKVNNWLRGEGFKISKDDDFPTGKGTKTVVTFRSFVAIAIAQTLTDAGFRPSAAGRAARKFTQDGSEGREPGRLFPTGGTVLAVCAPSSDLTYDMPGDYTLNDASIVNVSGSGLVPTAKGLTLSLDMVAITTEVANLARRIA